MEDNLTITYTYTRAKSFLDLNDSTKSLLQGLSVVELFCQQHSDHIFIGGRCIIDLNNLHQIALSGLCATLRDTVYNRLLECVSMLEEYKSMEEGI